MNHIKTRILALTAEVQALFEEAKTIRMAGYPKRAAMVDQEAVEAREYACELILNWEQLGMLPDNLNGDAAKLVNFARNAYWSDPTLHYKIDHSVAHDLARH